MKQAWIAGATGLVGQKLSAALNSRGLYGQVFNLIRAPSKTSDELTGVNVVVNYDELFIKAEQGADFFCTLGSTIKKAGTQQAFRLVDEKYVVRFAEEAKKSGARCFVVVSSQGADARSAIFYSRVKGQMEDGVRRVGLRSVYVLRPSMLMGERRERRSVEQFANLFAPVMNAIFRGQLKKYRPVQASRVAEIAIQCAEQGQQGFHLIENF